MSSSSSDDGLHTIKKVEEGGESGFNKFLEHAGLNEPAPKLARKLSSDDDTSLFSPKLRNLREDADVKHLLEDTGLFKAIDK